MVPAFNEPNLLRMASSCDYVPFAVCELYGRESECLANLDTVNRALSRVRARIRLTFVTCYFLAMVSRSWDRLHQGVRTAIILSPIVPPELTYVTAKV
jgi:hypothetical protein